MAEGRAVQIDNRECGTRGRERLHLSLALVRLPHRPPELASSVLCMQTEVANNGRLIKPHYQPLTSVVNY